MTRYDAKLCTLINMLKAYKLEYKPIIKYDKSHVSLPLSHWEIRPVPDKSASIQKYDITDSLFVQTPVAYVLFWKELPCATGTRH